MVPPRSRSTLPESFGLTPVQSVACGTPVVATPAGAVPGLLPPGHGMALVPFGDAGAVAAALADLPEPEAVAAGRRHIAAEYSPQRAAEAYLAVLTSARRNTARYVPGDGHLVRAPWCQPLPGGGLWHDYERARLDADLTGASPEDLQRRGLLVPAGPGGSSAGHWKD